MTIVEGWLVQTNITKSRNHGGVIVPKYIIIHYTASATAASAISWLCDPRSSASAHVVIDRDGSITQLVPFHRKAWHAGVSVYKDTQSLNNCSIGIELVNLGPVGINKVDDTDCIKARHKEDSPNTPPRRWQIFPDAQLDAAADLCVELRDEYKTIIDILGHDDIAPTRKQDPGPAFPMKEFRNWVMGG